MALPFPMPHKMFTVEEYEQMIEAGILKEDDRLELLRGEIVEMAPIGLQHSGCVARIEFLLREQLGRKAIIWGQNPILLPNNSLPEPDVALLTWRDDFYTQSRPTPQDVLLAIEVADTSLVSDRIGKVPIYAEAGIDEVWIVNLPEQIIEIYRQPVGIRYTNVTKAVRGELLILPANLGASMAVADILG